MDVVYQISAYLTPKFERLGIKENYNAEMLLSLYMTPFYSKLGSMTTKTIKLMSLYFTLCFL